MRGPTGKFPRGKLNEHDQGELQLAIAADHEKATVIIQFGGPVAWLGMPKREALDLGKLIIKHAESLRDA